jgi:hypothetical protein
VIRLGSLAGYPFEGPRLLAGWTPPAAPGVFAIAYRPDADSRPDRYAFVDFGQAEDLSAIGLPFRHPRAACWVDRAGSRWGVYVCTYEVPGGLASHREEIVRELVAVYRPGCHDRRYERAWKEEWIGRVPASDPGGQDTPPAR